MQKLILASKSPRRKVLLHEYGFDFTVVAPECTEISIADDLQPYDIPLVNAKAKARSVSSRYPGALVIGVDTVIIFAESLIGKPRNLQEAASILKMLSGRQHEVVSAVAVLRQEDNFISCFSDSAKVKFKKLSDKIISEYLSKVKVLDKAGAYALQEHGEMIIESINGEEENVIGLPRRRLIQALACAV